MITYTKLLSLRTKLAKRDNHSWDDFAALGESVLCNKDIDILRSSIQRSPVSLQIRRDDTVWEGDNAGKAALALLTRAGYCDLAADIRPWFIGRQDEGDQIYTTGPHVLNICVTDFYDGNALRLLYEFRDSDNDCISAALDTALDDRHDAPKLLASSRKEQISRILPVSVDTANNRCLRVLKTFIDDKRVYDFLVHSARAGRLYGLTGLLVAETLLDWSLYDDVILQDSDDVTLFINAMLENVSRGADPSYCKNAPPLQAKSASNELFEGLSTVTRPS